MPDPVSVVHQMTAVHRNVLETQGPVLQFDHPVLAGGAPSDVPVVVNLFGTTERVAAGLGVTLDGLDDLGAFLAALRLPTPPDGMRDALSRWPMLRAALATRPKIVRSAPVQSVVLEGTDVDLSALPVQTHWPGDAGPLITWPVVVTRPFESEAADVASYNAGVYRAQVLDHNRVIMRWLPHRGGAAHHQSWAAQGEKTPVAIVLGADPATLLSSALPLPESVSELTFAGALNNARPRLVPAKTVPLMVPADAEIVLEGWVSPSETAPEGPFGDHTGYYNRAEPFPVMEVSAITHRKDPLYLSTYTGRPPDEPAIIGEVFNRLALPTIRAQIPRDPRSVAAACRLFVSDGRCQHQQTLSGAGASGDDGAVGDVAAVQLYQDNCGGGRRYRPEKLGRHRLGAGHPDGSGARRDVGREHTDGLPRLCLAAARVGRQNGYRRHGENRERNIQRVGRGNENIR